MHYTDCCLSARHTATPAKAIRLGPKTSCHGLLCYSPVSWADLPWRQDDPARHPSMRNSLPPPGDPSIDQRWSSCASSHSHPAVITRHGPGASTTLSTNCVGRLPRGISTCLVTWLIDGLFVFSRRDALLERDRRHWRFCVITGASTTLPKNFAGGISTVFSTVRI